MSHSPIQTISIISPANLIKAPSGFFIAIVSTLTYQNLEPG